VDTNLLGKIVVDDVTGFQGTVVGLDVYISGCIRGCVSPRVDKEGKKGDVQWIDFDRLRVVGVSEAKVNPLVQSSVSRTVVDDGVAIPLRVAVPGGPQDAPPESPAS